jgi:WhiB family redox-sensing transcriptional regulator
MLDENRRRTTATPCRSDPDRWAAGGNDPELKALCRGCPRRWLCAKEALETPGAEGMWSGVHIPTSGRPRTFALRQLRSLATHGGYAPGDPQRTAE